MILYETTTLTKKTIKNRSFHYRNLIIFISLLLFLSPLVSLISLSWSPLIAWLAIPFFYSIFLLIDHHLLSKWQFSILSYWHGEKLKLSFLKQSLLHLPIFPENTIKSMIDLLPQHQEIDNLPPEKRIQIIAILKTINHCHTIRNILLILSTLILLLAIIFSFFLLGIIMIFYVLEKIYFKYQWKKNIAKYTNYKEIVTLLNTLDWYPLNLDKMNNNQSN